jgi:type IV secretory pathway VirB3-like protein
MNSEKVISGFFIILALTLNFGFVIGDLDVIAHHSVYELVAAIVVNLIATIMKLGDKTQTGSVLLATSFVADLQLIAAAFVWGIVNMTAVMTPEIFTIIVSLAAGALVANVISVTLFVGETLLLKR